MKVTEALLVSCILSALLSCAAALIEGLYCGQESCYDVLQVDRDSAAAEIRRAYRRLALEYHPDKNKDEGSRERFQLITTAYEILKDEEERANYDYMLDNPEQVYRHYYHYYRRRVAPKVDIRVVIAVTITVISAVQYLGWWHSHNTAIKAALRMPQYRMKAKELAAEKGLLRDGQKRKGMSKEEMKNEDEAILWRIMEENLNVLGGYSRPVLWDVLWFKIIFSPYTFLCYLYWYVRWVWLFTIRKQSYGLEEEEYLTRRRLGVSAIQWKALDEEKRTELVGQKLWVGSNWKEYKEEEEEKSKNKRLSSSKYKMYKRYMKNHGQKPTPTSTNS